MGSNHLSSTALQNKTIIVQLPMMEICFNLRFPNHAKNGDSVPISPGFIQLLKGFPVDL